MLELAAGEVYPAERARWEAKAAETGREPEPKLGAAAAMEWRGIRTAIIDVVREQREICETVKERAGQIIERGVEAAQEWRDRINDQLRAELQGRAKRREQQLAQTMSEQERQREAERRRELERERKHRRIEHAKMLEMIKERSGSRDEPLTRPDIVLKPRYSDRLGPDVNPSCNDPCVAPRHLGLAMITDDFRPARNFAAKS